MYPDAEPKLLIPRIRNNDLFGYYVKHVLKKQSKLSSRSYKTETDLKLKELSEKRVFIEFYFEYFKKLITSINY